MLWVQSIEAMEWVVRVRIHTPERASPIPAQERERAAYLGSLGRTDQARHSLSGLAPVDSGQEMRRMVSVRFRSMDPRISLSIGRVRVLTEKIEEEAAA